MRRTWFDIFFLSKRLTSKSCIYHSAVMMSSQKCSFLMKWTLMDTHNITDAAFWTVQLKKAGTFLLQPFPAQRQWRFFWIWFSFLFVCVNIKERDKSTFQFYQFGKNLLVIVRSIRSWEHVSIGVFGMVSGWISYRANTHVLMNS